MNKNAMMWDTTKRWCIANPGKVAAVAMIDGQFEMCWNHRTIIPTAVEYTFTDQLGDCVSCDGYRINTEDGEHCPSCARLIREGKPL